ncbi:MAG: hypothetical protein HYY85_00050 [Deltaproteobacteria bacterium]|nr:hypothetical protein [Deltaproteobacteria bacterium]
MLAANGLQYGKDYRLLNVGPSVEGFAALQTGQVAAGFLALPLPFVLADQGYPILGWAADFVRDFQLTSIGVERRWAAANRPVVVGYLRGMVRTFQWYYQEREAVIAYLIKEFKLQPRYAELGWDYYTKQDVWPRDGGVNVKGLENVIRILAERDGRRPPLPGPERYLDLSYWQEAKQVSVEKAPGRER